MKEATVGLGKEVYGANYQPRMMAVQSKPAEKRKLDSLTVTVFNDVSMCVCVRVRTCVYVRVYTFDRFKGLYIFLKGARCSSVVRAFAHGAMGCNKSRGMCYPVCGMVHIKEPLLLIKKSSLCGGSGFPFSLSEWSFTICLMPYNRK